MSLDLCKCSGLIRKDQRWYDGEKREIGMSLNWSMDEVHRLAGEMLAPPP